MFLCRKSLLKDGRIGRVEGRGEAGEEKKMGENSETTEAEEGEHSCNVYELHENLGGRTDRGSRSCRSLSRGRDERRTESTRNRGMCTYVARSRHVCPLRRTRLAAAVSQVNVCPEIFSSLIRVQRRHRCRCRRR